VSDVTIRRATVADVDTLAELGATTFVETWAHLYSDEDMQAYLGKNHTAAAYSALLADPGGVIWIAERGGRAIGYAQVGSGSLPHPDLVPTDGELKRLYLRASDQGDGIGRALMDEAMAWLLRDGPRVIWLSVWSENFGAQRFYARYGFELAGEYEYVVGEQRDREFMYRRLPS